jgi:predicted dehydrogenase
VAQNEIGVAIIGMGFMGRTHLAAYHAAQANGYDCRVRTLCDQRPEMLDADSSGGNFDTGAGTVKSGKIVRTRDVAEVFGDDSIQLVSICTPTDTHVDLAVRALRAGKHVLVEKPVALRFTDIAPLQEAAAQADAICMPAMCMRFWPGWAWLKRSIDQETYGPVRAATFTRLGAAPTWSTEFYSDLSRSGGALVDLHIHDADFVRWCFGSPRAVSSAGTLEHVATQYDFADGPPLVVAEGGWDRARGMAFKMGYRVSFERAVAEYEGARHEPLMLARDGDVSAVPLESGNGYDAEIRHILDLINGACDAPVVTIDDALAVARVLEAERRSLETGGLVRV